MIWNLHRPAAVLVLFLTAWPAAAEQNPGRGAPEEQQRESWQKVPEILSALDIRPGAVVADIGAGGGFFTVRLSQAVGPTGRVYAVDVSTGVLEKLRKRVADDNLSNVTVIEGSAGDPRLPAATLDAALIINSYHEMPEHQAMLASLRQALKPGGRLVIIEPISLSRRDVSRDAQIRSHEIGAEHVQLDAREAGFRVARLEDPFVTRRGGGPEGDDQEWLLVLRPAPSPAPAATVVSSPEGNRQPAGNEEDPNPEWKSPALRITVEEFKRLQAKDGVLVLDVRDAESYQRGHLPGAILMPLETVTARAAELRGERKPIITYCS